MLLFFNFFIEILFEDEMVIEALIKDFLCNKKGNWMWFFKIEHCFFIIQHIFWGSRLKKLVLINFGTLIMNTKSIFHNQFKFLNNIIIYLTLLLKECVIYFYQKANDVSLSRSIIMTLITECEVLGSLGLNSDRD